MITAERLRALFHYDRKTGVFTRKVYRSPNAKIGDVAGTIGKDGYVQIQIDGTIYKAHRLAWLYVTGEWPAHEVDHDNLNRADNAWCNLRDATHSQNNANTRIRANNTSGFKGACFDRNRGKWFAQIQVEGRCRFLGHYPDAASAHAAYREASTRYFGEFARAS